MKSKMLFVLASSLLLLSCGGSGGSSTNYNEGVSIASNGATSTVSLPTDSVSSSFSLTDESGIEVTPSGGVYTISAAGTYVASGRLEEGQIYVNAPSQVVEIDLQGVSVSSSSVSPIFAYDCEDLVLKAKNGYDNYIYDNRTTDYSTSADETIGQSAIYVRNGDLKINGKGSLSVTSLANSGVQCKDNVTVKNVTMLVKAVNNGIKGNDKVTIEENPTLGIVAGNNGIRTSNSDKGTNAQHGYIYVNGGNITINSYGDGIDAAYAVSFGTSTDENNVTYTPTVDIYTNIYSSYSYSSSNVSTKNVRGPGGNPGGGGFDGGGMSGGKSAEKADDSAKGIKAVESIEVTSGDIYCYTYDDGLHTNADTLENGSTGAAKIDIKGGNLTLRASDDAVHADGTLTVSGGTLSVAESHEGLEGKNVVISGGTTTVVGSDDGVNASNSLTISGGRLDVTVSPSGDTDGIDSNGSISITGGVTITRGPNSEMAAPLDADGSTKMTGGTLIVVGYAPRNLSTTLQKTTSSAGLSSGSHTVTVGSETISYSNSYTYSGSTTVYGSSSATVK